MQNAGFRGETSDERFRRLIRENRTEGRRNTAAIRDKILGIHVPTPQDTLLDEQIDWIFDSIETECGLTKGNSIEQAAVRGGRALLVIGKAGAGKSRAIEQAFKTRPEFMGYPDPNTGSPVLSVIASSPFTLGALGNELVRALGYQGTRNIKQSEVWPMVRGLIKEKQIRIIHIDEAQHGEEVVDETLCQEIENTLKRLMQEKDWPVWLILSGLPTLAKFCQSDASMRRRIRVVRFDDLVFPGSVKKVRQFIVEIAAPCRDILDEAMLSDEFVHRLMHAAMYQLGLLAEYVQDAIIECIEAGDQRLDIGHFADVYVLRTGEREDSLNPFLANDWTSITVETALLGEKDIGQRRTGSRSKQRREDR